MRIFWNVSSLTHVTYNLTPVARRYINVVLEVFFIMVHCIMVDCFHNSGKTKGIGFYRIPVVVTNQGEKAEELSRERRER